MSESSENTKRDDSLQELQAAFEESLKFQKELKAKMEQEGRAHEESNRLSEEQLDYSDRIIAQVDEHTAALKEMAEQLGQITARFAREDRQYQALVEVLEAREEAAEKALGRLEADDKAADALEAELRDLKAKLEALKG